MQVRENELVGGEPLQFWSELSKTEWVAQERKRAERVLLGPGGVPDDRQRAGWIARFRMMATRAA
jgi:hypothetical protein